MANERPSPSDDAAHAAEVAYKKDRALLRAIYTCQQVLFQGKLYFVHSMYPQVHGGGVETIVYLMGDPTPHPSSEITFLEAAE